MNPGFNWQNCNGRSWSVGCHCCSKVLRGTLLKWCLGSLCWSHSDYISSRAFTLTLDSVDWLTYFIWILLGMILFSEYIFRKWFFFIGDLLMESKNQLLNGYLLLLSICQCSIHPYFLLLVFSHKLLWSC